MPFSNEDLIALDKAIASGALSVKYGDKMKTFRSVEELLKARELVSSELAQAAGTSGPKQVRTVTSKGW
jgi:hypothetical protein